MDADPPSSQHKWMSRALELARHGEGAVEPNPMVGCVIVRDGSVICEGYHEKFGGPHAEANAIAAAESDLTGATAYVTLEPCCHQGKTPPCSSALIGAGISRVVVAMRDPFPKVDGGGLKELEGAGVETEIGLLEAEARALNAPYLKRVQAGLPWVIAKWAITMDGRIATVTGESQWITSPASRAEVHQLRSRVDAVCVGMGTVEADDPMLTARLPDSSRPLREAARVVFCRSRVPSVNSKLVQSASDAPLWLVASQAIDPEQLKPLADLGAKVLATQTDDSVEMVRTALSDLAKQDMTNVMIEGGAELLASFLAADQIDEAHVYMGPKIFGGQNAKGPIGGQGIESITDLSSWELQSVDRFDSDVRVIYRKPTL